MKRLYKHDWPGNVRELRNVIERMAVNAEDINITIADIPKYILKKSLDKEYLNKQTGLKKILGTIEKDLIIEILKDTKGNKTEAAEKLKIQRTTLYRKMEEYNITEKDYM